jgi:hypothetical protein
MKKIVLTFGLISGAILSAMMLLTLPFMDSIGFDRGEIIGYTTMVLAFLLIFFGVRSYRDNVAGGAVGFRRALGVGSLIAVVASVCYVATWQVVYYKLAPDFGDKYKAYAVENVKSSGDSPEEIATQLAQMDKYMELYRNPAINIAITFIEPLPLGLVFAIVSAGILSRKRRREDPALATA